MKKVLIRQEKLTVDGIWKEQGFRLEDEVIEDSMEQIEPKQVPCEEGEYNAKHGNSLIGHKLAQHKEV